MEWFERTDARIVAPSLSTVTRLFGDLGPELTYVRRWSPALPHTRPGAYRAIADFAQSIDPRSPVQGDRRRGAPTVGGRIPGVLADEPRHGDESPI